MTTQAPVAAIATTLRPVSEQQRLQNVDILRGIALLGILLMNIDVFAMPEYFSKPWRHDPSNINFWYRAVITVLFEGKMRALFSMLFGVGILLFSTGKEKSGWPVTWLFYRRMWWLILFGIADAHLLLWIGDILYLYGVCGLIAYLFRKMKPVYLAIGVPLVAIVSFVVEVQFYQDTRAKLLANNEAVQAQQQHATLTEEQKNAIDAWREYRSYFLPNMEEVAEHTAKMKSDYAGVAGYLRPLAFDWQTKFLQYMLGDAIALMLLGMALYKWGFLSGKWTQREYVITMIAGYGIGLPLVIWNYMYNYSFNKDVQTSLDHMAVTPIPWMGLIYPFQRMLLVMAHASLILILLQKGVLSGLMKRLGDVGRMAFTNYVMHTVICTLVFFGYGLNQFDEWEYYQLYYLAAVIWVFQLWLSPLWLKYYLFGPLEWVWRSLTYWKLQPFQRNAKA